MRISGASTSVDLEKTSGTLRVRFPGVTVKRLGETGAKIEVLFAVVEESFVDHAKVKSQITGLNNGPLDNIGII